MDWLTNRSIHLSFLGVCDLLYSFSGCKGTLQAPKRLTIMQLHWVTTHPIDNHSSCCFPLEPIHNTVSMQNVAFWCRDFCPQTCKATTLKRKNCSQFTMPGKCQYFLCFALIVYFNYSSLVLPCQYNFSSTFFFFHWQKSSILKVFLKVLLQRA